MMEVLEAINASPPFIVLSGGLLIGALIGLAIVTVWGLLRP